jgi:hypothetical protein
MTQRRHKPDAGVSYVVLPPFVLLKRFSPLFVARQVEMAPIMGCPVLLFIGRERPRLILSTLELRG